ncbi:hypothetical protein Tco_0738674 [Tanacetum coccineum]
MDTDSTQISIFEIEQSPPPKKNKQVLSHRLTRVFSEDYKHVEGSIFNPRGDRVKQWNRYFLVAALISIAIDPLFYYLLEINVEDMCMSFMDPSHSSALSSVSQNSHVVSLNALTEEIVAYEKESDDTHAVKNLDALCTPESFVTHSNFDTPGGTVYYIPKVSAAVLHLKGCSTLMNFMNCFETAMEKQRHVQERLDYKTIDTVLKLKTYLSIERHASNDLRCIIKESPYVYEMPNKKKKPQSVDKGNDKADENDKVDMFFKKDGLYKVLRSVKRQGLGAFVEKLKSLKKEVEADCPNPPSKNKTDNLEQLVGVSKPAAVDVNNPTVRSNKGRKKLHIKGGKDKAIEKSLKGRNSCSLCGGTDHNKRTCPGRFEDQNEVVVKKEVGQEEVVEYYEKIVLKFDIISNERSELVRTLRNGVKKFEDDQMMIDFCKQYRELFNDNEFKLYEYSKDDDSEGETDGDNEDNNHDDDGAPTADANKKKESENQTKERNKEDIDKQTEESGSEGTDESGSEGTEENGSEATEGGSDGKEENMNGDEKEVTAHMDVDSQNKDLNKEKDANETEDNDKMNNIDMKNDSIQEKQDKPISHTKQAL